MARTKTTARKTTGGKLASKLKDKKATKRKSQSKTSSSEDESPNSLNFPPKKKYVKVLLNVSIQIQTFECLKMWMMKCLKI